MARAPQNKKKKQFKRTRRRKLCPFTTDPEMASALNYKNPNILRRFISERGRIVPRRISGVSSRYQRQLSAEIKRARTLALLPYTTVNY
jgi:small subunit ribosomal protein S18